MFCNGFFRNVDKEIDNQLHLKLGHTREQKCCLRSETTHLAQAKKRLHTEIG